MVTNMFTITFSDGRRLTIKATCPESARAAAYRIDRSQAVVAVDAA